MGKASTAKTKVVSNTLPQLYEETVSGPSFIVDVGNPIVWVNTTTTAHATPAGGGADGAGKPSSSSEEGTAVTARWGHATELSPNESVLCIIGGRPCDHVVAAHALDLIAWTTAHTGRSSKAPHVWQSISCQPLQADTDAVANVTGVTVHKATSNTQEEREVFTHWPHYAPWWAMWQAKPHEPERPVGACVDGGWGAGRRLAKQQTFVPVMNSGSNKNNTGSEDGGTEGTMSSSSNIPHTQYFFTTRPSTTSTTKAVTRSHHTVTAVQGARYRFGGETQEGTVAALEKIDDGDAAAAAPNAGANDNNKNNSTNATSAMRSSAVATEAAAQTPPPPTRGSNASPRPGSPATPIPAQPQQQVPSPRAAHGACCLCQRYLFVFGGRRVEWPVGDATISGDGPVASPPSGRTTGGNTPGKALVAGKAAAASRAASVNKRGAPAGKAGDSNTNNSNSNGVDPASSAAVLTALKDVAVYDTRRGTWLSVQITGGPGPRARYAAAVAAVPTSTSSAGSTLVVNHREVLVVGGLDVAGQVCADAWLLQILSGADGELADTPPAASAAANPLPVVTARWVRLNFPSGPSATPASSMHSSGPSAVPITSSASATVATTALARHHAAVVVSSQRTAYVVGGCGLADSSIPGTKAAVAAQPTVYTLALPHLTSTMVHVEDVSSSSNGIDGSATAGGTKTENTTAGGAAAAAPSKSPRK